MPSTVIKRAPISTRVAVWLGAALVTVAAVILGGYWTERRAADEALVEAALLDLRQDAQTLTMAVAEQTRSVVYAVDLTLTHIQQEYARRDVLAVSHLADVIAAAPPGLMRRISIHDREGALTVVQPPRPTPGETAIDEPFFKTHAAATPLSARGDLYIGAPVRDGTTGEWLIPISRALRDRDGNFAGVVKVDVAPEHVSQTYDRLAPGGQDIVALVRQGGEFMARNLNLANHLGKPVRADRPFLGPDAPARGWFHSVSTHEPVDRMFAWQRLEEWPIVVVVGLAVDDALAPLLANRDQSRWAALMVTALVASLVAGVTFMLGRLARSVRRLSEAEQRLSLTFAGASELVWEWNTARRRLTFYGDCEAQYGRPGRAAHFSLDEWMEWVHPDDRDGVRAKATSLLRDQRESFEVTCRMQTPTGDARWSLLRGRVTERDSAGQVEHITGILIDVDAARRAEQLAAQTRESYQRLIESASEGIYVVNARGLIEIFNPAAERLLGLDAADVVGTSPVDLLEPSETGQAPETWCPVKRTLTDGIPRRGEQVHYRHRDGHAIPVELNIAPTYLDRAMVGAVVVVQDIAERLAWAAELQKLARTDGLTGVANRRHFIEQCQHELQRSDRDGSPVSMLMIDIDHFKLVNDEYGHAAGDALLSAVAAHCAAALRQVDIFGRLGGEEFGACLPGVPCADAVAAANRLRAGVADLVVPFDGRALRCSISIGVATRRTHENLDKLMARADARLFIAKSLGRDRVATFSDETATPGAPAGA